MTFKSLWRSSYRGMVQMVLEFSHWRQSYLKLTTTTNSSQENSLT